MEAKNEAEKFDQVFNMIKNFYVIFLGYTPIYSPKSIEFFNRRTNL